MKRKIVLICVCGIVGSIILGFTLSQISSDNQEDFPDGQPVIYNPATTWDNVTYLTSTSQTHHSGFHYMTNTELVLYACFDAKVERIDYNHTSGFDDHLSNGFAVPLKYNEDYVAIYRFEFFNPGGYLSDEYIRSNVYVEEGQWIHRGDPIGRLVNCSEYTHICFSVWKRVENPSDPDEQYDQNWCLFQAMAPGVAEDVNNYYQTHKCPMGMTENVCWCWNLHEH